jgi:ubiquinone/menaquinone biosynthesis C-methylase UbiE
MPPATFSPGVIDYSGPVSANYQTGRALSPEAASTWLSMVAPFARQGTNARILDLGAGTGRFARLFARSFPSQVLGVEPSMAMLAAACDEATPKNLTYVAGSAERIPVRNQSCDLVWLSHVWHHIRDHETAGYEIHRVVASDGHVLVRGTLGDQLDGFPDLFRFWPGTRHICQQLPTLPQTIDVFAASGFNLTERRRVHQATAADLAAFAERTRLRADTALALLSDAEFQEGQAAIELAAGREHPRPVMELLDLLVFRKDSLHTRRA